jgi:hypothetical protein
MNRTGFIDERIFYWYRNRNFVKKDFEWNCFLEK